MSDLTLGEIANLKMVGLNNNVNNMDRMYRAKDMLEFMQELSKKSPSVLKDTTMGVLCSSYSQWTKDPIKPSGAFASFTRLVKNNVIIKYNRAHRRACFKINYFHPSLGDSFIQNASDEDKQEISKALESLREKQENGENATIDEFGAITTKALDCKPEEPREPKEPGEPREPKEAKEKLQMVPVKVEKTPNGINLSITLNLNIN